MGKRAFLCIALLLALAVAPAAAETRIALVIGNANYAHAPRLANPPNDAVAVAAALRQAGFTTVTVAHDLGEAELKATLETFSRAARNADVAVVDYSGHGIEVGGSNYLVPVDATLASDADVDYEAVPLDLVLHAVEGARRLRLVLLDACRSNPFATTMVRTNATRAIGRGLARVEPSSDTLVVYAAKAGSTASDGDGAVSPFSAAFARDVVQPGVEISKLFRLVHDQVMASTGSTQEPFVYGSLSAEDFYFVPPSGGAAAPANPQPVPAPVLVDPQAVELAFWNSVANSTDAGVIQSYLDRYPNGIFAGAARAKIAALGKPPQQVASIPPTPAADGKQQVDNCNKTTGKASIDACTWVIQSGSYSGADLASAFHSRGVTYFNLKQYARAIQDYDHALLLKPDFSQAFFDRGVAHHYLGKYKLAIQDDDRAIALQPNYPFAYGNRGYAYDLLGQHARAIEDYDRALALQSNYPDAYNNRGLAYEELGQYTRAIQDYNRAIALKPDYALARSNLAIVSKKLGKPVPR